MANEIVELERRRFGVNAMAKRNKPINLPAPYLRRVWLDQTLVTDPEAYPFCLPFLAKGFEQSFDHAITIIVGENGVGKSTLRGARRLRPGRRRQGIRAGRSFARDRHVGR